MVVADDRRRQAAAEARCLAVAGLVVYGLWEADGGKICRRNAHDSVDKRRCVTYERVDRSHFRNSDGVGFCLGPCENDKQ